MAGSFEHSDDNVGTLTIEEVEETSSGSELEVNEIREILSKSNVNLNSGKMIEVQKVVKGKLFKTFRVFPNKLKTVTGKSSAPASTMIDVNSEMSNLSARTESNTQNITETDTKTKEFEPIKLESAEVADTQPLKDIVINPPITDTETKPPMKSSNALSNLKTLTSAQVTVLKDSLNSHNQAKVMFIKRESDAGGASRLVAYQVSKKSEQDSTTATSSQPAPEIKTEIAEEHADKKSEEARQWPLAAADKRGRASRVMKIRKQNRGDLATLLQKPISPMTSRDIAQEDPSPEARVQFVIQPEYEALLENLDCVDDMHDHVVPLTEEPSDPKFEGKRACARCKYCDYIVLNKHDFRKHIRVHKDVEHKPWQCPLCDYRAQLKATIRKHINIHSEVKAYRCSECGKGFNFRQKLQQHMKYHKDIRDFYCPMCPLSFHELKTLKNHITKLHFIPDATGFLKGMNYRIPGDEHIAFQRQQKAQNYRTPKPNMRMSRLEPDSFMDYADAPCYSNAVESDVTQNVVTISHEASDDGGPLQIDTSEVCGYVQSIDDYSEITVQDENPYQVQEFTEASQESQFEINEVDTQPRTITVDPEKGTISVQMYEGMQADSAQLMGDGSLVEEAVPDSVHEAVQAVQSIRQETSDITTAWGDADVEKARDRVRQLQAIQSNVTQQDASGKQVKWRAEVISTDGQQPVLACLETDRRLKLVGTRKTDSKTLRFQQGIAEEITAKRKRSADAEDAGSNSKMKKVTCMDNVETGVRPYVRIDKEGHDVKFVCRVCESGPEVALRTFDLYTKYLGHLFYEHSHIKPFVCKQCSYACRSKANLISHSKIHEGSKKFVCKTCSKQFLFKQKLRVHMRVHENRREHVCSMCQHGFNEKADLNRHFRKVHMKERSVACSECNKRFYDLTDLKRHLESHSASKLYECGYCHKFYQTKVSLNQHIKSHTCIFHCEICSRDFGSYSGFMAHKVMHDESSEGYLCEYCDKKIMTKGSMKRHMQICHSDDRPYMCDECPKSFKAKKDLKSHYVMHEDERVYVCEVCSFASKRIETLRVHMRRHQAVLPFQCGVCNKQYTQKNALEQHMAVHIEKQFSCEICKSNFLTADDMNTHMLDTHVPSELREQVVQSGNMTVYMCEECHSVFVSQDALAVHILEQHMGQTHSDIKSETDEMFLHEGHCDRTRLNIVPLDGVTSDVTSNKDVIDDVTHDLEREETEVECEIVMDTPELMTSSIATNQESLTTTHYPMEDSRHVIDHFEQYSGDTKTEGDILATHEVTLTTTDNTIAAEHEIEDSTTSDSLQPVLTDILKRDTRGVTIDPTD